MVSDYLSETEPIVWVAHGAQEHDVSLADNRQQDGFRVAAPVVAMA